VVKAGSEAAREWRETTNTAILRSEAGGLAKTLYPVEVVDKLLAAYARERELLRLREATKLVCAGCAGGLEHVEFLEKKHWHTYDTYTYRCKAAAIHQIIEEIEAEEQP
jgi:hypothetical protein